VTEQIGPARVAVVEKFIFDLRSSRERCANEILQEPLAAMSAFDALRPMFAPVDLNGRFRPKADARVPLGP